MAPPAMHDRAQKQQPRHHQIGAVSDGALQRLQKRAQQPAAGAKEGGRRHRLDPVTGWHVGR